MTTAPSRFSQRKMNGIQSRDRTLGSLSCPYVVSVKSRCHHMLMSLGDSVELNYAHLGHSCVRARARSLLSLSAEFDSIKHHYGFAVRDFLQPSPS